MIKKSNTFFQIISIIVCFSFAIVLLLFNEIKHYENNKKSNELKNNTIVLEENKIDINNNNNLVLASGKLDYNNQVQIDNYFEIKVKTPKLLRYIEVYQWDRYKEKDSNGKTTYVYYKKWSSELIDSTNFIEHDNPTIKAHGTRFYLADSIKLGEFDLSKSQIKSLPCNKQLKLKKDMNLPEGYKIYKNYITDSIDPKEPEIGDTRVSFSYNNWKSITILAKQSGNSFKNYYTYDKDKINILKEGKYTIDDISILYKRESKFTIWSVRFLGVILLIFNIKNIIEKIKKKNN